MDEEVLLDFKRARSRKKVAYKQPGGANGKNESPSRGKLRDGKLQITSSREHDVSHFLFIFIFIIIKVQFYS